MNDIQIADPLSTKDIWRIVGDIRRIVGLENDLYFPVVKFAELTLQKVDGTYNFIVRDREKMPDKYAYYDPVNNEMVVREDVYEMACNNDGRHRFTIAHEIGHYFLHRDGVKLARLNSNIALQAYRKPEWQANTFASELLMPHKLIRGLNVDEVQQRCCTSGQAAEIALNKAKKPSW